MNASMISLAQRTLPQSWLQTADFLLSDLHPSLGFMQHRATVVAVHRECEDTHTLILSPDSRWQGFIAGQHLTVTVDIAGVRYHRTYSISSSPTYYRRYGKLMLTIKGVSGGNVSARLPSVLKAGQIIGISSATGTFLNTFSEHSFPQKSLFIAAGSGITPFHSLLDELAEHGSDADLTLLYYVRHEREQIFAQWLRTLPTRLPNLKMRVVHTRAEGRIKATHLREICPDIETRDVFLCGPAGFMDTTRALCTAAGVARKRLFTESFGPAQRAEVSPETAQVRFEKSRKSIRSQGGKTLLELAEMAGLQPKYGCRSGICHECSCQRTSGRLIDAATGKPLPDDQTRIQACMAIPAGPVTISSL